MQRLLSTTDGDPDKVRDALVCYIKKHLGNPKGILAIDETGFLKKGTASAGAAGQYPGTAGRVKSCQIRVFLNYAAPAGRTFLDRELYLPQAWMGDPARCKRVSIPAERVMVVPMNQRAITPEPGTLGVEDRPDELFTALYWRTRTSGTGTKGERL